MDVGIYCLNAPRYITGLRMLIGQEKSREEIILPQVNQFAKEMDHFSMCISEGKTPWTPGEEVMQDLKLMLKIYEAAHEGKTVRV